MSPVVDAHGRPVAVTDVVDVPERLPPLAFWSRIPEASSDPSVAGTSLWSYPLLRRHFFFADVSLPARVHAFHSALPVVSGGVGARPDLSDPSQLMVVAGDVPHRPILTVHPKATGTYSPAYYPRRTGDWLESDFLPAYAMCGDHRIGSRLSELLSFMLFSQYGSDGSNEFVATCYPSAPAGLREWVGGWDYVFDWEWLDGYGYQWQLHEPDHHVNAMMAATMVRAYELTGTARYLESARAFVYHQVPRYGFHSGVWRGRTYYWTEYNPSGEGNPVRDATDNVQALVAQAVAMVGLRTGDRRMLSFARGLLWHCVREWVTDGRWYYDSAENPINQRKSISHDMATLLPLLATVPYLLRGGVELDVELDVLGEAYEFYLAHFDGEPMDRMRLGQLSKLASGGTTFFTANQAGTDLVFSDRVSTDVELRVWSGVDPVLERVVAVTADDLARGVPLGLSVEPGDVLRFTQGDAGLAPSAVSFHDAAGARRSVTASVPTVDFPTDVTAATYADAAMRLCCPD